MCAFQSRRPHPNAPPANFGPNSSGYKGNNSSSQASLPRIQQQQQQQQQQQSSPVIGGGGAVQRSGGASSQAGATSDSPLVIEGAGGRILCVADIRGNLKTLNELAAKHKAQAIIHTGDFGFYSTDSLDRISDKTLRHLVQYSGLISHDQRTKLLAADQPRGAPIGGTNYPATNLRSQISNSSVPLLSEFPLLLDGRLQLNVPVFTVWGACEDVAVLERLRAGEYQIPNLQILDEATTRAIHVGDVRLRLFGLGGAVVLHKLFDNGDGAATIAGGQGIMWTTMLQIGELVDTAQKTFDPTETRVLITHASPGREGLLAQLAVSLKADFTVSAGLHFRYGISYNEFGVQHDSQNYRNKMVSAKTAFGEVWDGVKAQVEDAVDAQQRILLDHALAVTNRVPLVSTATGAVSEEYAWKNTWNWNLSDAAHGALVFDIAEGRLGAETYSSGFNFAFRKASGSTGAGTAAIAPQPAAPLPAAKPQPTTPAASSATPVSSQPTVARAPANTTTTPAARSAPFAAGRVEAVRANPSASSPSAVRSPPTGPAAAPLAHLKSPPVGPKAYQQQPQHQPPQQNAFPHHRGEHHGRGGRAGGAGRGTGSHPNGSAPSTDTEAKDTGVKKQSQQQSQADKEWDKPVTAPQTPVEGAKTSGNASGPDGKPKKPRTAKKGKGGPAALHASETSGAEAVTSGNESSAQNTKKGGSGGGQGQRKEGRDKEHHKDREQHAAVPRPSAAPAAAAATTAAAAATPLPSDTPGGVKSSGDEGLSSAASGAPATRGGKEGGRGGRGARGGGGSGRGGRGGRGGGRGGGNAGSGAGSGSGADAAAGAGGGASSASPAPSAPAPAPSAASAPANTKGE